FIFPLWLLLELPFYYLLGCDYCHLLCDLRQEKENFVKSAATILAAKEFSQVPAGVIIITAIIPTATASMRATPILITATAAFLGVFLYSGISQSKTIPINTATAPIPSGFKKISINSLPSIYL
ncbi:hypothetical protein, partial [Escherichia coli]|uniref:hypothetical protein n=2 Tax=Escherichia coli TaxID=562 RepID=UPI001BFD4EA7